MTHVPSLIFRQACRGNFKPLRRFVGNALYGLTHRNCYRCHEYKGLGLRRNCYRCHHELVFDALFRDAPIEPWPPATPEEIAEQDELDRDGQCW
jgi:hypothetical protein